MVDIIKLIKQIYFDQDEKNFKCLVLNNYSNY